MSPWVPVSVAFAVSAVCIRNFCNPATFRRRMTVLTVRSAFVGYNQHVASNVIARTWETYSEADRSARAVRQASWIPGLNMDSLRKEERGRGCIYMFESDGGTYHINRTSISYGKFPLVQDTRTGELRLVHKGSLRRVLVSSSREATITRPEDHEEVHARTAADEVNDRPPSRGSSPDLVLRVRLRVRLLR